MTGLTVTPGDARLAVNWTAVDNATGYKVQWKSGGQGYNTGDRQFTVTSGSTTSHTITGLANGTEYTVRVSATRTGANDGPPSAEETGTPAVPIAPGVTVSTTALTVTEQDTAGDGYTVVLDTEPTANVTVTVAGHAGTDVTPDPGSLTFTASNWDTAQTVTVTAGDDADTTDDSVTLTHSAASTDSSYGGIAIDEVAVTVSDNDTARVTGLTVTPGDARLAMNWTAVDNATGYKVQWKSGGQGYNTGDRQFTVTSGSTTSHTITGLANGTEYTVRVSATRTGANDGPPSAEETGTPAVPIAPGVTVSTTALTVTEQDTTGDGYTVVLDTEPTANVTVTVAGHAGTDVTPNPTTLTFTASNWDAAQTVTVTAGDDADTADDSVALTHSAASADNDYSGIAIDEVAVTVSDNDTARVTGLTVAPGNAQLVMNWTAVDNATGYKVQWKSGSQGYNTGSRQFTVTSGSTTSHTITGLANGTEYTVRVSATRTGANDGPPSAEETGTPAVPTAPGVTVSTTALTVTEQDTTGDGYTVALDTEPTANVTVTVAGHAGTDVTPNPATLTFTASNWDAAQTVTVTAGDDADTADDTVALTHSAASTDSNYSGITIPSVAVTVSDNDTARVTGVSVTSGNAQLVVNWTAVDNATGYKVQWKSVGQDYNATNRQFTIPSGTTTSHTITGLANGTEYSVRVSATRTGANDGPPSAEETGTPAVPTAPGVTVSTTALTVTEQDTAGDGYTVVLDTEPTANVTVTVAGHAGTDVTPDPGSLTFTASNWDTAQTVTVTAGDDADTTDDSVTLTHSAASTDSGYSGIAIAEVAVTVSDNDTARVTGLTVAPGNAQLVMNWTAVDNATGHKVQWKSGSQGYNATNRQFTIPSGTTTSHTITGLANGTEYSVRVSATRTGANDGPPSAEVQDTPAVAMTATSEPLTLTVEAVRDTVSEGEPVSYRIVMSRRTPGVEVGTVYRYEGEFVRNALSRTITGISSRGSVLYWEVERDTLDDAVFEADGGFTVRLQPGAGYTLGTPSSATVRILDNDGPGDPPTSPPPVVSLTDARVREGPSAVLGFTVRLDRAPVETAMVDWETLDGSAKAGEDYVADSGTLVFALGETVKTVNVAVLDDAHDEGQEVMLLVLPNAQGAVIGDAVAKGTIENSDRMPTAWLARFGRAASDHVVEAVGDRWQGGPQASHLTLGGRQAGQLFGWSGLGGRTGRDTTVDRDEPVGTDPSSTGLFAPSCGAGAGLGGTAPGMGVSGMNAMPGGPGGVDREAGRTLSGRAALGLPDPRALPDLRTVLMGSSFFYSAALDDDGRTRSPDWLGEWSAWGRTAATRFQGNDEGMALDGEVATAMLGFDSRWDRWLAGVVFSYSEGQGAYTHPTASGGAVASTMTGLHPYARFELNEHTSVWGVLGYGAGELSLTPERSETALGTDLTNAMAAFGGRTALSVRTGRAGRFELAVRSDARLTSTASEAIEGLVGAAGQTGRVRLMLEGSGSMPLATGGVLKPKLEAGLRYDAGDAETGAGLEVGGGLGYAAGRLSVQVDARGLLAHQDTEYEEWGFSGSITYTPSEDGRGLSMRLGSAWGATQSGVQSLWNRQDVSGLARHAAFEAAQRYQAELRYGLDGRKGRARWEPYVGVESGDGSSRALRLGVALTSGLRLDAGLELGRRQGLPGADPEHAVQLRGELRW